MNYTTCWGWFEKLGYEYSYKYWGMVETGNFKKEGFAIG